MKVFVLECGWNYDGGVVIGVFKEKRDAENEATKQMECDRDFDWYEVTEFEVN